ncbi:NUMOD3 domain-containing DNA-binding protein [Rugamonas rubra]|uniref:NUMOD3 domain-containing DNA-binding protein n=1 Tax=Rugamonas rubra TaxID=758825 RepID=UPI0011142C94|nr:NUMOD3 domain-containing DNA-binding protein [Rugamonas rubra]
MSIIEPGTGLPNASGIYSITNAVTGKFYIGSAVDLRKRRNSHFSLLRKGAHHSAKLQSSFAKHGEPAFSFQVLLLCSVDDLLMYEQRAIDAHLAAVDGYNMLPTAGNRLGVRHSPETRAKIGAKKVGVKRAPFSAEHIAKLAASQVGHHRLIGYKHTDEARANMRARGFSPAHRAAISASMLGKKRGPRAPTSPETRAKLSAAGMGNTNKRGKKRRTESIGTDPKEGEA